MAYQSLETSIEINAPAARVWRMFDDAEFTRQMGGEYVSEWTVGSSLGWRGLDGQMLTNGMILAIEPKKLLKHSLFNVGTDSVMATLIYELNEKDGYTTVLIREDFEKPVTEEEHHDSLAGWGAALAAAKELVESGK